MVIPALTADPTSIDSDEAGLKELARDVLGQAALSPAADEARSDLFKDRGTTAAGCRWRVAARARGR